MKNRITAFFILCTIGLQATHNRAGEITYRWLGGLQYEATITTYTRDCVNCADRCQLAINWGDGSIDTLTRLNGPATLCPGGGAGQIIAAGIKKNVYRGVHTYPSSGAYIIFFEDPNRNGGIANIPNSIDVPFYVQTELLVLPALGPNSSPILTNPPIEQGCIKKRFEHNAGAFDPDGDSLAYRLTLSRTTDGQPLTTIYDPQFVQDSVFIDASGTLIWDVPQRQGEYNFAFEIIEYRQNSQGQWVRLGTVTRDMQVRIEVCDNEPPVIPPLGPFCVVAGDNLRFSFTVTDPNDAFDDRVSVSARGGPFEVTNPADPVFASGLPPVLTTFNWNTACNHIRKQPYEVLFRAKDSLPGDPSFVPLTDLEVTEIKVLGPPPLSPSAQSAGRDMQLTWSPPRCANATGYRIYRREGLFGFVPGNCETGVPASTGYELIQTLSGLNTTQYLDTQNIKQGIEYCYLITALYGNDLEGVASREFCAALPLTLPMMTQVDVRQTSTNQGSIAVDWIPPPELDSALFPPPYAYRLYRGDSIEASEFQLLQSFTGLNNTGYIDTPINTQNLGYTYLVSFLSGPQQDSVGAADAASSVFLEVTGQDMRNELNIQATTPWLNERYVIFRESSPGSGTFDSLTTVFDNRYRDTGLVNGQNYCYRVQTIGRYTASDSLPEPLLNRSQVACGVPVDTIAPCPPLLSTDFNCETDSVFTLSWENPADPECQDDVLFYNLFYKAALSDEFDSSPIRTNITSPSFRITSSGLPEAGCYAIQAVDDADNNGSPNFSALSNTVCVEPCPKIEFPNIFTPNGDGINDAFRPITFQDLGDIQIVISNRWGTTVFQSSNDEVFLETGWDGRDQRTQNILPDGVYFYHFRFRPVSQENQEPRIVKGFVHLVR